MTIFDLIICAIIGYLIGGFSTAITFSLIVQHKDIRNYGSGNAGATNMLRNFGWMPGLITFVIDILKGAFATYIGLRLFQQTGGVICGVFAVIGHTYPIYYGFKGGKGISVTIGVMSVLNPMSVLICFLISVIVILITRIISIASISGSILLAVYNWIFNYNEISVCIGITFICVLNIIAHRENIKRLLSGTEAKMNWKELSKSGKNKT